MFLKSALRTASKFSEWQEVATVYVHWPYCEKRCTFCNFNKYIKKNVNHERMARCLSVEAETLILKTKIKKIKSIYFGGGTPSLATPQTISDVIGAISKVAQLMKDVEVTLECNPTLLESNKLREFRAAGINRVSVGIQALNDSDLQVLGRTHTARDSLECLATARRLFPDRVSVDMIFGRPKQSLEAFRQELRQILDICDRHVSLYQLTLERGTSLFKSVQNKEMTFPDDSLVEEMYLLAVQMLEDQGFKRYEASNFAKQGAESVHNQAYWDGTQYVGLGPGAHGRFQTSASGGIAPREARIQTLEPEPWMEEVERQGHGTRKVTVQDRATILEELLMTSLRTSRGLINERWCIFSNGRTVADVFEALPAFTENLSKGFCSLTDGNLVPTSAGLSMANTLVVDLLPAVRSLFSTEPS